MSSHQSTNHQLRPQAPAAPSCQSHCQSKSEHAHSVCNMSSKHHAPSTNQRSSDITSIINKPIMAQRILKQTPLTITQRHRTCQVAIIGRSSRLFAPRSSKSNHLGHHMAPQNTPLPRAINTAVSNSSGARRSRRLGHGVPTECAMATGIRLPTVAAAHGSVRQTNEQPRPLRYNRKYDCHGHSACSSREAQPPPPLPVKQTRSRVLLPLRGKPGA